MNPREFFLNPADYGLPTREELVGYRIWDNHFHGFAAGNPIEQYERNSYFVERMGIERSISQEVVHLLSQALEEEAPLSILELKGLGKERWRGVDPSAHVARERRSWD